MKMENEDFQEVPLNRNVSMQSQNNFQSKPFKKRHSQQHQSFEKSFFIIETKIYIFTESYHFSQLNVLLTDMAQPITKPAHINQFEFTKESLLRAKSLGYSYQDIISVLEKNMRNEALPERLKTMIFDNMNNSQCCKLYLLEEKERNVYYFQIVKNYFQQFNSQVRDGIENCLIKNEAPKLLTFQNTFKRVIIQFKVKDYKHNILSERLFHIGVPVLSEKTIERIQHSQEMSRNVDLYKNKGALHCKNLKIELKAFTKLREYQSQALKSVVKHKNKETIAKSGYIVLPCGAGKTLLGIAICTKIKKQTLIVCSSDSGADQWKRQIQKWTQGIHRDQIIILTAKSIENYQFHVKDSKPHIYISTYSNLKSKLEGKQKQGENKKEVKNQHEWIKLMPWGLIVFDEAQWLPAPGNSLIANSLLAHVKIGLTATPLREDNNIKALIYMIGPQLYVGSWKSFVEMGYLANPKCLQIRTKMTRTFDEYYKGCLKSRESKQKQALYMSNPNKIKALIYLLEHHEKLNDNIIVFCDKISLIYFLAEKLQIPLLHGKTSIEDRNFVFDMFREGTFKTILLSRIGDQAIDLPNANVAIQLNIHKGSRRQMLQRLGRIMRPKEASSSQSYNAVFYTIVSQNTLEMNYFRKRRDCLVDLGFQYDLRLFEYTNDPKLVDIYRDDKEIKDIVRQKYQNIIPSESQYWSILKNQKETQETTTS